MNKKSQIITVRVFSITFLVAILIFVGLLVGLGLTSSKNTPTKPVKPAKSKCTPDTEPVTNPCIGYITKTEEEGGWKGGGLGDLIQMATTGADAQYCKVKAAVGDPTKGCNFWCAPPNSYRGSAGAGNQPLGNCTSKSPGSGDLEMATCATDKNLKGIGICSCLKTSTGIDDLSPGVPLRYNYVGGVDQDPNICYSRANDVVYGEGDRCSMWCIPPDADISKIKNLPDILKQLGNCKLEDQICKK